MSAKVDSLATQAAQTVHVDMEGRTATCSAQWLLEKSKSHPIHQDSAIQTLICGEDGFGRIAKDLEAAKASVYLVCWGFDPGMALVRNATQPAYPWAAGEPYGELLKRLAAKGIQIKLLVWYNSQASAKQNSLIGYVVPDAYVRGATVSSTWDEDHKQSDTKTKPLAAKRQDYCTEWWRQATAGLIANLVVCCRDALPSKVKASVAKEADPPSEAGGAAAGNMDEKALIEKWATHHQKPVLIDYDYATGSKAVGYIMGLNSVSDYWDSAKHTLHDPMREQYLDGLPNDNTAVAALARKAPTSRKPLQDYACRIQGLALQDLYKNFAVAWNTAELLPRLNGPHNRTAVSYKGDFLVPDLLPKQLALKASQAGSYPARLQVLRTQPEESHDEHEKSWAFDKSIKHAYFQASSFARSYIYVENQYFFYEEWARHLKANRKAFVDWVEAAGKDGKDVRLLHLMVVIPAPEDVGMLPRTYDTLKSLGQASSLPNQHSQVETQAKSKLTWNSDITNTAIKVKAATENPKDGVLMQDGKSLGLKALICKMATPNLSGDARLGTSRDIYIHSKLMLIDDNFMTVGSANLNQRSMAADSEINVATDCIDHNRDLRKRIWGMQTGHDRDGLGGEGTTQEVADAFQAWKDLSGKNKAFREKGAAFAGFIVKFEDDRTSTDRVG